MKEEAQKQEASAESTQNHGQWNERQDKSLPRNTRLTKAKLQEVSEVQDQD